MTKLNKLAKVDDSFTVNMYDNGYMVEVNGRDNDDNWATQKVICNTMEELIAFIKEVVAKERS